MIVKQVEDLTNTEDHIDTDTWESRRFILKKDNMGFSMHETIIKEGTETHMWYQNHFEAVYCIEGEGEIETVANGKVYPIKVGTLYALNEHDEHYLRANKGTHMRMVCVFNPPCTGREVHDERGVYPLLDSDAA
ncbi:MAG TPA: ectoine synthase [Gammaproteobacteria bacterium]|nr:ectoine synthase [Gammaproteobacteria bacterium]